MKKYSVIRILTIVIYASLAFSTVIKAQNTGNQSQKWTRYEGGTAYSISVPSTVELRDDKDAYSQALRRLNLNYNNGAVVFQQKGLSSQKQSAFNKYCRIIIQYYPGEYGGFLASTETEVFDSEWKETLNQMVHNNLGPSSRLMGDYTYKWITVNGVKCVQVDYKRTGSNYDMYNPVICRIAIFQNNNEMVVMILSYREKEAGLWKADFEKVFRSFKWI